MPPLAQLCSSIKTHKLSSDDDDHDDKYKYDDKYKC